MKLEHFFLGLSVALLLVTSALMVHYRTELYVERERAKHMTMAPTVPTASYPPTASTLPQTPAVAPTPPPVSTEPISSEAARLDEENLRLKRQLAAANESSATSPDSASTAPTPTQASIMSRPAIAKVTRYLKDEGVAEINAGSSQGIKTGQTYAVRRGQYLVAPRLVIGETVEADAAAAMVDLAKMSPGETLQEGDEIIQWD